MSKKKKAFIKEAIIAKERAHSAGVFQLGCVSDAAHAAAYAACYTFRQGTYILLFVKSYAEDAGLSQAQVMQIVDRRLP